MVALMIDLTRLPVLFGLKVFNSVIRALVFTATNDSFSERVEALLMDGAILQVPPMRIRILMAELSRHSVNCRPKDQWLS